MSEHKTFDHLPRGRAPVLGLASAVLLLVSGAPARAESLADLWAAARGKENFQQPDRAELRAAEDLFRRTLDGKEGTEALRQAWRELHWDYLPVRDGGADLVVVRELPEHRTGRGFYAFRRGHVPAIALEAPHGTDDLHTGRIALALFGQGETAAGAWNTVPRAGGDLAHLPDSYFQAFTRAFAAAHPHGLIVQLHGFEAAKRTSAAGMQADAIASNGTRQPPGWLLAVGQGLRASCTDTVKVYPIDIRELGGTTNAQAQLLQGLGHDGFLHVEMSLAFRQRLREEPKLREDFLKCITGVYRKERSDGKE